MAKHNNSKLHKYLPTCHDKAAKLRGSVVNITRSPQCLNILLGGPVQPVLAVLFCLKNPDLSVWGGVCFTCLLTVGLSKLWELHYIYSPLLLLFTFC